MVRIGGAVLQKEPSGADYLRMYGTAVKGRYSSKDRFEEYLTEKGISGYGRQKHITIGGRRRVVDFLFEAAKLIVQVDGYAHRHSKRVIQRDLENDFLASQTGWKTLRIPVSGMHDRCYLEEIAAHLSKNA